MWPKIDKWRAFAILPPLYFTMTSTLFHNIRRLWQVRETKPSRALRGEEMAHCPMIENAWLLVKDGRIEAWGSEKDGRPDATERIDCQQGDMLPGYVDSHTHLVFAEPRNVEFEDRIRGLSYEEIAQRGGGILNSAAKLATKSEDELFNDALKRAHLLIEIGTLAIEIKSGYGLDEANELKMLRVIKRLKENLPIPVKSTFLGAHAIPPAYKQRPKDYVIEVAIPTLEKAHAAGLVDYVDAFCEKGYFGLEETELMLRKANALGLKTKIHVNQFNAFGGVKLCADNDALSVDHLEEMNEADYEALEQGNTLAVALPSCSFFLQIPYTPVRKMLDRNIPVVLASDYNPGSTPSGNLNFVFSLACIQMKMTPQEALNALTINAAFAIDMEHEIGSITRGKKAHLILTKAMPGLSYLPYAFGENVISKVFVDGKEFKR